MSTRRASETLLVVDSNPITLLAIAGVLDGHGYACFCARSGEAALRVPEQTALDAAIIDVGDDAEGALGVAEALRTASQNPDLPVILLADACWSGLQLRCEQIPATRCLFQPIDPNVLVDLVHQSLWMPHLIAGHRRRGSRPSRPGWVHL